MDGLSADLITKELTVIIMLGHGFIVSIQMNNKAVL